MADNALNLRRVYADICRGYSVESWGREGGANRGPLYLKHLSHFDQVDLDLYYDESFDGARRRGVKTQEERLKWLEIKGLWSRGNEDALAQQKSYVDNLERTKSKMFLKSQIRDIDNSLVEARGKLYADLLRKDQLIGLTCEKVADQRIQFYYVHLSCFKDRGLTERMFTLDDINQWYDDESVDIINAYVESINRYSQPSLKKIALAPYFTNYFHICGDNVATFFNKPIAELSMYQINLLSYAIYYKSILANNQVPDEMRENPDRLEEFVNKSRNVKEALSKVKSEGGRVGLVGATKEDLEALNMRDSTDEIRSLASKGYSNTLDAARGGIS